MKPRPVHDIGFGLEKTICIQEEMPLNVRIKVESTYHHNETFYMGLIASGGAGNRKPGWKGKRRSVTQGALKRQLRKWRKNPQTLRFPFAFVKQTSPIFVTGTTTVPMEKNWLENFPDWACKTTYFNLFVFKGIFKTKIMNLKILPV